MDIIQPSNSPWASPIVLVKKKDGTMSFCMDNRQLNAVTKKDTVPLPRIDDLLDQLGRAKFFSTLGLASSYWQIQIDKDMQEKSAFITHSGLYEFKVMPFGLTNAPSVFQRVVQQLITTLNPKTGSDFVNMYIDDVIAFSQTFEAHLRHLKATITAIQEVGLKLNPTKCHFARAEIKSHQPVSDPTSEEDEQLSVVTTQQETQSQSQDTRSESLSQLLQEPSSLIFQTDQSDTLHLGTSFTEEQSKDDHLKELRLYLTFGDLPSNVEQAKKICAKSANFAMIDSILYYLEPKRCKVQLAVVPDCLKESILHHYHGGKMTGHFSAARLYRTVSQTWWWEGMYQDVVTFCHRCPQCAISGKGSCTNQPPLQPIPVQRPFQMWGVDIMELPRTKRSNRYVIVFQDFFTKWPLVFPTPDQTHRIVQLFVEELIPVFGVPESLLSDRGGNLLVH